MSIWFFNIGTTSSGKDSAMLMLAVFLFLICFIFRLLDAHLQNDGWVGLASWQVENAGLKCAYVTESQIKVSADILSVTTVSRRCLIDGIVCSLVVTGIRGCYFWESVNSHSAKGRSLSPIRRAMHMIRLRRWSTWSHRIGCVGAFRHVQIFILLISGKIFLSEHGLRKVSQIFFIIPFIGFFKWAFWISIVFWDFVG